MPSSVASRRSGIRIRRNLLRRGTLRAVFTLPEKTGVPTADLWIMRRPTPDQALSEVLFVARAHDLESLRSAWRGFTSGNLDVSGQRGQAMPVMDLLDDEAVLSPARHHRPRPTGLDQIFGEVRAKVAAELSDLPAGLPLLSSAAAAERPATVSIARLLSKGWVAMQQAPLGMRTADGDKPVLLAKDLRCHRAPTGLTVEQPGLVILEPGDVVVPLSAHDVDVHVISSGGAVLGPQLLLVRPRPEHIDSQFIAGFLRIGRLQANSRAARTSHRIDLRATRVPSIPLAEQRRYGEVFRLVQDFRKRTHQLSDLVEKLSETALLGLDDGCLLPPAHERGR
jgi:hypothetical protein